MEFPFSLQDLGVWLACNAIILLITSELILSSHERRFNIEKKRLRMVALILGVAFLIIVLMKLYEAL